MIHLNNFDEFDKIENDYKKFIEKIKKEYSNYFDDKAVDSLDLNQKIRSNLKDIVNEIEFIEKKMESLESLYEWIKQFKRKEITGEFKKLKDERGKPGANIYTEVYPDKYNFWKK